MTPEFKRLVDEVAEVSKTAAKYLEKHGEPSAKSLAGVFVWVDTPAGHKYWSNIANKIKHGWRYYAN